ncbi:hypothetical protein KM176_23550 [Pseudooceanicola sp. CBS1P-1]|uniref:Uncharacterized protein n=1 Tax=Pseudooceanicola albus TaxID=2692189 RepID=A0A6L7G5Z1_9RHOB|nr:MULTISPECIES: DUF6525 family protein [Pseudooceanicola]MBT9386838.1 hypothetical protein [Pseudooceanicola endophyticus]MXN19339.1 hypothetical protein [Pseudooceanicola albus]
MARRTHRGANLSTSLRRRRVGDPMAAYDRLPPDLRRWLAGAALPWSAASALRAWQKALRTCGGDCRAAGRHLSRIEQLRLGRDAARVWGPAHPAASGPGA